LAKEKDMAEKQKIAWVGLGKMGIPMSQNLLKKGYSVTGYNRTKDKTKPFADAGGKVVGSPKEAAAGADVIISMIADDAALEAVSIGPGGAFESAKSGAVFIDMSTVSPGASGKVDAAAKKKGIKYLRAPVSGSTVLATGATLTIFASGPKDAYDACAEILGCMGSKVFHVGTGDEARYLKLVMNMMVGLSSAMAAEALTFGEAGGMNWEQMIDIVGASVVASPLIGYKSAMLKARNWAPAFTASQMAKDFDIMIEAGRAKNVPMPMTALIRQFWSTMMAQGKGEQDFFSLVSIMEQMAGMKK
jgi:3-hydroxyisobutyrate dehydrogenase-like beta-hydroxyacid dehydrogenase